MGKRVERGNGRRVSERETFPAATGPTSTNRGNSYVKMKNNISTVV